MKATKRQVKGYYFSLKTQMPNRDGGEDNFRILNGTELQAVLEEIRRTPLLNRFRNDYILTLRGDSIRGDGVSIPEFNGYTSALFMRKRSTDLPKTAHEDGDGITVNNIMIEEDSFFMETTYVLINNETATVLFLVNGNVSTSTSPFARYLKDFIVGEETQYIETVPILNTNSLRRLENLETLMGIELSYRGVLGVVDDQNMARSMGSVLEMIGEASRNQNTGSIKIMMSAARNKSLDKEYARLIHRKVMDNEDSKKCANIFRVRGKGGNGIETIDFLNDEFLFTMESDVSARNLDPAEILGRMHSHFEGSLRYIKESIGN